METKQRHAYGVAVTYDQLCEIYCRKGKFASSVICDGIRQLIPSYYNHELVSTDPENVVEKVKRYLSEHVSADFAEKHALDIVMFKHMSIRRQIETELLKVSSKSLGWRPDEDSVEQEILGYCFGELSFFGSLCLYIQNRNDDIRDAKYIIGKLVEAKPSYDLKKVSQEVIQLCQQFDLPQPCDHPLVWD